MSRPSSSKIEIIDIEALEVIDKRVSSSSAPFPCSVCYCDLSKLNITARQNHYDEHFPDPKPRGASPPRRRRNSNPSPTYISSSDSSTEDMRLNVKNGGSNHSALHDAFWHASMQSPPPANYTPGLILILKKALISSHEKGHTQRAVLCYERAVHIYREYWDKTWGCGYRNYMMASAALMDQPFRAEYFALLDSTLTPGVRNLQLILEEAWAKGYDEEGAEQLKKQLHGTDKWIGTAELHVAFAYQGIPSQLVDFVLSRGQGAQVVRRDTAPLLDWIKDYFSPPDQRRHTNVQDAWRGVSAVTVTDRMPFVLQHNGHSRTIVGYEIDKKGQMTLLTFDPSRQVPTAVRELALGQFEGRTRSEERKAGGKSKTSKFMETIKHPFHGKRGHSPGSPDMGPAKRIRAGAPEIIEIGSDSEEADSSTRPMGGRVLKAEAIGNRRTSTPLSPPGGKAKESSPPGHPISPGEIIKAFRVDATKLAAQEKYQILWFPLADPLTEQQKLAYRVVVSEKIC